MLGIWGIFVDLREKGEEGVQREEGLEGLMKEWG